MYQVKINFYHKNIMYKIKLNFSHSTSYIIKNLIFTSFPSFPTYFNTRIIFSYVIFVTSLLLHIYRGCAFYSLPQPILPRRVQCNDTSPLGLEESRCSGEGQVANIAFRDQCLINYNVDQRHVYDSIIACLEDGHLGSKIFNINAPGGSGKTFVLNGILAHFRSLGYKCIAAASSGIAATLLNGGRTAHSFFGLPIPILNTSMCNITLNTKLGKL